MGKQQKEKPGTMIYFDIASSVKMLSDEEAGKLFKGILEYSQYGVVPDFDGQYSMLGMAWGGVVKPALDRANEHYIDAVYKQKIKGLTSAFKSYATKNGLDPDDEEELRKYIAKRISEENDTSQHVTAMDNSGQPKSTTVDHGKQTGTVSENENGIGNENGDGTATGKRAREETTPTTPPQVGQPRSKQEQIDWLLSGACNH